MDKTRNQHVSTEDREFKLLLRRDAVTGALSVAASSSGAWASNISLGVSAEGMPCCTAVISPSPDMLEAVTGSLVPEDELECADVDEGVIEQTVDEEPAAASATAEQKHADKAEPEPEKPKQDAKPAEQLEGRPFEEIAKEAAKKASDVKPSSVKQPSKPLSGSKQAARTITGGTQVAAHR